MRTFVKRAGTVAVGIALVAGVAYAASDDQVPEARAYMGLSFGGSNPAPRDFHYGLRLDQDSRYSDEQRPALIQLDYTTRGLNDLRVNGLSAMRQSYRYNFGQFEEEAAADAEPGFFEKIGNWFGGLFGGDDDAEEAADAADDAVEEYPTEGSFLGYNAIDWGLVAVGAVGLGFAATEAVNGDDTDVGGGGGGGAGADGGGDGDGGIADSGLPGGLPSGFTSQRFGDANANLHRDREHRKWLDGGTGQMGDID